MSSAAAETIDPPRENRAQRRKARTEKAILESAEELFLERGFHGVTVDEIADFADVAVGSIYGHFNSKEGLYIALLERALEVEERHMAAAFDESLSPIQQLFRAGESYLRFYFDHPGYFRILVFPHLDARPPDQIPVAAQRLAEKAEGQVARLAEIIESCARSGIIRAFDPYLAAKFMLGAWNGVISLNLRADRLRLSDEELQSVIREGTRMLAEGLAAMQLRDESGGVPDIFSNLATGRERA